MQSYTYLYTYASQKTRESYKNYVTLNYGENPTYKPTCNTLFSFGSLNLLNDIPSAEPTEYSTIHPLPPPPPPFKIENNTCICKIDRSNQDNVLIIATSITSSLCVTFFIILVWYRFIFKKNLMKWKKNEENFGFGGMSI